MSVREAGLSAAVVLLWSCAVTGATRHVPGDYPTIQAAINAAVPHDVVLVAEGTYNEQINFLGKEIKVASYFDNDGDPSHISHTTIVATYAGRPETLSAVLFISGETSGSQLKGFTIVGNGSTYYPGGEGPEFACGGTIFCSPGHPTISNCILKGDACAVYFSAGPSFVDCAISDVVAYDYGADPSLVACSTGSVYIDYGARVSANNSTISGPVDVGIGGSFGLNFGSLSGSLTVYRSGASISNSQIHSVSLEMDGGLSVSNSIVTGDCAIWGFNGQLELSFCTVLGRIVHNSDQGELNVYNSIVSTESDTAIYSSGGYFSAQCVVVDTTVKVPIVRNEFSDTSHIFHAPPRFCDPATGEYAIRDNSICAAANNACNQLIGARSIGCSCCIGVRGNANNLLGVDVSDLSVVVLYLLSPRGTVTGNWCPSEANVDGKGIIDLSDLAALTNYLTSAPGSVSLPSCSY